MSVSAASSKAKTLNRSRQPIKSKMADSNVKSQILAAKETFEILQEISRVLNTGLDSETLTICVRLCESGVNPEALATVIKELRKEAASLKQQRAGNTNKQE